MWWKSRCDNVGVDKFSVGKDSSHLDHVTVLIARQFQLVPLISHKAFSSATRKQGSPGMSTHDPRWGGLRRLKKL